MMAAVVAWFRLDVRRRWRSLLVLALLIALASGVVMTAVAGARRGGSAMDRLLAETWPATVMVAPMTPGFDWDPIRALPGVEALAEVVFAGFEIDGQPADSFMLPPADAEAMWTIERPAVLDGRLADPARADEVVITSALAEKYGKSVGDDIALGLYTPEQVDTGQGPANARTNLVDLWILTNQQQVAAVETGLNHNETASAAGPVVEATIVGTVRSPWFGDRLDTAGFVVPSAGLYAEYTPNLVGADGLASINALVRLDGGEAAIPGFLAGLEEVTGRPDIDVHNLAAVAREIRDANGFEAQSLFFFAVASGIAAVFLVGLSITRYATSTVTDVRVLRDVGMAPGQSRRAAATGPTVAAAAGTMLGATAAVVASRWFPIGSASLVEPTPGVDVDVGVLVVGLLVVPMLVAAGATAAAMLALRSSGEALSGPRSAVTKAAGASLPVPVVMGVRFALEPGRGRTAVPVRPALLGAVAGVTGVLAALTFSSAVQDAATNPARFGVVHELEAWVGFDNVAFAPADTVFAALADVPGVTGVNGIRSQVATTGGSQVTVLAFSPVGRQLDYVVTEGRLPAGPAETLLSRVAASAFGSGLGDTVTLTGTRGDVELAVVGIGVIDPALDLAVITTPAAYDALFDGEFMFHYAEIGLEHDVDPAAILPKLSEAVPAEDVGLLPYVLEKPVELRFMRPLPALLAGLLAVLALGAVGHAVATAVRRRRRDVAVLRALGMTPGQSRRLMITQATVLALAGLVVGIPLGVALGRTVWRYVADTLHIHYVPPVAWLALILVVPLSLLAVNLVAAWPGHRAASMRVGHVLRTE